MAGQADRRGLEKPVRRSSAGNQPPVHLSAPIWKRAHATAQAFADVLGGIEPVDDRRVRERSFGDWDGHAVAELAERYPEDFRSWMESRGGELKYGAEPKEAVGKRGVEAL